MAVVQQPAGRQRAGKIAATQEETRSIGSIDPVRSPRGLTVGASICAWNHLPIRRWTLADRKNRLAYDHHRTF